MSAPRKSISDVVGQRMLQLSLQGYGARRISKIVASEYGPESKYSHTYIQNFLNDHASVSNTFEQNETSTQIVNPEPSVEQTLAPVAAELQVPPRYLTSRPYATVSPSTLIVPYPVPPDPAPPGDSMNQVILDLIRAKGMAAIKHSHEKREASFESTDNKNQDNFQPLLEDVKSYIEQQREQREETAKRLESVQDGINEHRKWMEAETAALLKTQQPNLSSPVAISDTTTSGTKSPADETAEPESSLTETIENNQSPRTATHEGTQAGSVTRMEEVDSTAVTSVTVKSSEPTTAQINNSKNTTHEESKQTDPLTTADMPIMSSSSGSDPSITSTGMHNDGFNHQPDSTEPETFKILEPDQSSVANKIPGDPPPGPTEQNDQLRFKRIQAAQDTRLTGSSHNRDDSSTNQLWTLVGLSLGILGFVCGIDYLKARANSKSSRQVNRYNTQPSTPVEGYARINDPNGAANF